VADIRRILLEVSAETGDARRELAALAGEVEGFGSLSADARLGLDAGTFRRELAGAAAELTAFRNQHADASLGLDTKAFTAELAKARAEMRAFGREHATGSLSTAPLAGAIAAERGARPGGGGGGGPLPPLRGLADDAENDGHRVVKTSQDAANSASEAWQGAALNIRSFMTIGMTAVVAAIIAVLPAVALLAASLVGAAVAAGGLATALAGAAGPALLALIPLISGVSKVFAAFKVDEQNKQLKQSIIGRQQLGNATLQHARAEQQLQLARRDASRGIRDALHQDQQATQAVGNAQFDLKMATRDAYRAWQDSINGVKDAIFSLRDAQLEVQQAKLTKQQALLDLRNLRKEVAATGTELDHFFNKITEVQLDPKRVAALLPQVDQLGLSAQQSIDVKQKLLDISKANEGVGESEQKRREAEINLTRAIQRRNEFEQQGLKAYRPLVAAQQQAADASWASARASEHLADVQKQGVAGNPQVLAAQDALRTSNQQLAASTNKSRDAWAQVPRALRFLRKPLAELHKAYVDIRTEVTRTWAPVIGEAVRGAGAFLKTFSGRIASLASTQARAAGRLIAGLGSPRAEAFFKRMFGLADKLTTRLSSAFGHLLAFLSNVADAATKPLERASGAIDKTFANWDRSTTRGSKGGKRMSRIFDEGTTALGKWFKLLGALGQLLLSFFDVTSGQSGKLLDSLTKTVNKWNEWVNSKHGKSEIRDFFEKVMPAAKETMSALGKLFEILIAALPTIITLIGKGFSALSTWLGVLKDIYGFLNKVLSPGIAGIGTVLLGVLIPLAIVRKAFKGLAGLAGGFAKGLLSGTGLEGRAQRLGKSIGARLRKGIGRIFGRAGEDAVANAPAAGETRAAIVEGGTTAAAEIGRAMIAAGRVVAAEIAAAMRTGGVPTFGGPRRGPGPNVPRSPGRVPPEEPVPVPTGRPRPRPRGRLGRLLGGASVGALGFTGGVVATGLGVLGAANATAGNSQAALPTRVAKSLQGFASGATLGLIPSPSSFNAKLKELEQKSIQNMNFGLAIGRHSRAGILAGLGGHSGLTTGIENQLRVAFRNLGERATGGLGTLRKVFNENLRQIDAQVPRHSRSWTRAVSENMRQMVAAIGRNASKGRISMSDGFAAIERAMRSHMVRGKDAVRSNLRTALASIERFRGSSADKLNEAARVGRIALHRLGIGFRDLKKYTDSEVTAMATLAANTKLTADQMKSIIDDSKHLPDPKVVDPSAFDPPRQPRRPRKRGKSAGGSIPGYGGGDRWDWLLEGGEFVLKKESAKAIGPSLLGRLNADPAATLATLRMGADPRGATRALGHRRRHASASLRGFGIDMPSFAAAAPRVARDLGDEREFQERRLQRITNHFNVTTAPAADQTPDPGLLAAQLSLRMRARGLS
jgi:hypothetical protein